MRVIDKQSVTEPVTANSLLPRCGGFCRATPALVGYYGTVE
jgi:hypothetical protein